VTTNTTIKDQAMLCFVNNVNNENFMSLLQEQRKRNFCHR